MMTAAAAQPQRRMQGCKGCMKGLLARARLELGDGDDGLLQRAGELAPGVHNVLGGAARDRHPVPRAQLLQEEAPPAHRNP